MEKFEKILEKIKKLKALDKGFSVFGSKSHKYKFGKCLIEDEILEFEYKYGIELPEDYRNFFKFVGNGGAGPYYGLNKLNEYQEEYDNDFRTYLTKPFPYKEYYHLDYENFKREKINIKNEDEIIMEYWNQYSDYSNVQGSIIICHFGCSKYFRLIIEGEQRGKIWLDGINDSDGLIPQYKNFGTKEVAEFFWWYENWLNESINKVEINANR